MFSEILDKTDWEAATAFIASRTASDVRAALSKEHLGLEDFMALVSPAAEPFLEEMARRSHNITLARFGKTISMYIPLYVSNACANACVYCGFNHHNRFDRVTLTQEQVEAECRAIKKLAPFENLLIVSGEHPRINGPRYIGECLDTARQWFANLSVEVGPMKEADYKMLTEKGLNGVVCFQETYNRVNYRSYHPEGMKSIFDWRVNAFDRMGRAGVHKIGMGVLIGLEDWRTDLAMLALHLRYLRRNYWRTKYSVNFPRLCPAEGGYAPKSVMTDRQLAQVTFAFRIFDHDVDISYSTREQPEFRANMMKLGVTSMSAGSKTEPGGYCSTPDALEQFAVSDPRSPLAVAREIKSLGYEAVWKDWDSVFDGSGINIQV